MKSLALFASALILAAAPVRGRSTAGGRDLAVQSNAAVTLKQDMRKLWTDHVVWTRSYIVAAVADAPDAQAAANRLIKNQEDIGKAFGTFYGEATDRQLTTLLKEHITIAVDLVKAAKAGDMAGQQQADSRCDERRSRRATEQELGGGRQGIRCGLRPHPQDVRRALGWNREAVPG